jgi:hypothetical protein
MSGVAMINVGYKRVTSTSITTAGLVLNLDAGNPASYPGSGTTWTDTISSKAFSLFGNGRTSPNTTNPPTYSSDNGGYLAFNNSLKQFGRSTTGLAVGTLSSYTAEGWWYVTSDAGGAYCIITERGTAAYSFNYAVGVGVGNSTNNLTGGNYNVSPGNGWNLGGTTPISGNTGVWKYISVTYNNSTKNMSFYMNGTLVGSVVNQPLNNPGISTYPGIHLATRWDPTNLDTSVSYLNGRIAIVRVYNAELTSTQVTDNFNAEKTRFGY